LSENGDQIRPLYAGAGIAAVSSAAVSVITTPAATPRPAARDTLIPRPATAHSVRRAPWRPARRHGHAGHTQWPGRKINRYPKQRKTNFKQLNKDSETNF
jgi:hypothetical protein